MQVFGTSMHLSELEEKEMREDILSQNFGGVEEVIFTETRCTDIIERISNYS